MHSNQKSPQGLQKQVLLKAYEVINYDESQTDMVIFGQAAQRVQDPYKVNITDEEVEKIIRSAMTGEDSSDDEN